MSLPITAGVSIGRRPRTARLDSLTGVRAIAALLVFWHHGSGLYGGLTSGMVGVSLFYMLSGFVMAWVSRDDDTAALFYRRRFARIVPAYLVAVTLGVALRTITTGFSPFDLSAYTLLQNWVPDSRFYFAASTVFWSLSCEAFFYLMFPLLRQLTRRLSARGIWAIAAVAGVISITIGAVGSAFPVNERLTWAVVVFPPVRLPEFVVGVCLGTLMARGWRPRVPLGIAFPLAAAAVVIAVFTPYALSRYAVTLIPFAVLILALAGADLREARVFTRARWMVKLGEWSYAFYLVHLIVIMVVIPLGARVHAPLWVSIVVALVAAEIAAWLLHIFVERPAERVLRPKGRPRLDTD